MLIDGASTTSCGSLFQSLTIRKLKKFCLTVVRYLGLNNYNECPLSPLVKSASSKNLLQLTRESDYAYGEMKSQNLWSHYVRHFVGITWHNVWS